MTAKEYLRQLQDMEKAIEKKQDRRREILYRAKYVTANYSGVKVRSGSTSDRVADAVIAAETLQEEINSDTCDLLEKRYEIINQIHKLQKVLSIDILYFRYVQHKSLKDIAKETGYTAQYIRTAHGKALLEFEARHPDILQGSAS
jgi:DNA-directed RNA polymerase specialized sigma subunit